MIAVSDRWKEVQKDYLVPLSDIQIEYNVTDPGVQEDATATATPEESFSGAENVVAELRREEVKYATLEHNLWLLDGGNVALPPSPAMADGFISSNLSNSDGSFTAIPTITITFGQVHTNSVPGLSLIWSEVYEEYATRFRVTAYNGTTKVAETTVEDNRDVQCLVWVAIAGYNKIVIEILEWCLPYRRARLLECLIGIKQIYGKADLLGFSHEQTANLLSAELPKNAIVFELDNSDNRWNPDNPTGAERYLIQTSMGLSSSKRGRMLES